MTEREDRQDISDLLVRYATGIDRRDWPHRVHRRLRTRLRRDRRVEGVDAAHCHPRHHHNAMDRFAKI